MWRRPVVEGAQEVAELLPDLRLREAEGAEHPVLHLPIVDADAAPADLLAIDHQVVGPGAQLQKLVLVGGIEIGAVRGGEGVMA